MNSKGFTLVELITTFAVASVIIIFLMNIVVILKNIYSENNIKTELIIEQSNLSNLINSKFVKDSLKSYDPCDDSQFCYNFTFRDESSIKLIVDNDSITFGSYIYKIKEGTNITEPTFDIIKLTSSSDEMNDSFLVIRIPIESNLYPDQDFGFNIVYPYNSKKVSL